MDVQDRYREKKSLEGKPPLQKIDPLFLEQLARVLDYGDKKHADTHWMKGLPWSEIIGAVKRHIAKFESGEVVDKESTHSHLIHAVAGLMFMNYYCNNHEDYSEKNDLLFFKEVEG
jgi:hypothetical protein